MDDNKLKQTVRDAAAYAKDARSVLRFKLKPDKLQIIEVRLTAASNLIDLALEEIDRRLEDFRGENSNESEFSPRKQDRSG